MFSLSLRVLRCQLPISNEFYAILDELEEDYYEEEEEEEGKGKEKLEEEEEKNKNDENLDEENEDSSIKFPEENIVGRKHI